MQKINNDNSENIAAITQDGSSSAAAVTAAMKLEEEKQLRVLRWRSINRYFPWVSATSQSVIASLRCMKTAIIRMKYTSLGEFLYKIGIADYWLSKWIPTKYIYQSGWIKTVYDSFILTYSNEFNRLYFYLKDHLETKRRLDDLRRREELIASAVHGGGSYADGEISDKEKKKRERDITIEQLKRLGIDASSSAGGDDLFKEESSLPEDTVHQMNEEAIKQDVSGLIMIEYLKKHVIGFHSLEIIVGKARIVINVTGLDVFELLPELPSMLRVQQDTQLKPS